MMYSLDYFIMKFMKEGNKKELHPADEVLLEITYYAFAASYAARQALAS